MKKALTLVNAFTMAFAFLWLCRSDSLAVEKQNEEAVEVLPLPAWSSEEGEVQVFPLGGSLWPEGYKPDETGEGEATQPPGTDEQVDRRLRLFIPKPSTQVRVTPVAPKVTPAHELHEVSAEFLELCDKTVPGQFLTDPLHLLNETPTEDLRRLLEYHSGESRVRAHVLVLDTDQQLPKVLNLSKMAGGELADGLACLVAYPLAEPWRVRLFMSRGVTEAVPPAYLQALAQACVQDAMQVSDEVEQLQRFAIQLSIRLIWLERAYPAIKPPEKAVVPLADSKVKEFEEVAPFEEPQVVEEFWAKIKPWLSHKDTLIKAGIGLGGGVVALILLLMILRRMRKRARSVVWILPETQVPQRLGGPHCGGGGASINYG